MYAGSQIISHSLSLVDVNFLNAMLFVASASQSSG